MTTLFEVRMPACDRPDLLRRALDSLIAQTYPHWMATIFDDSTSWSSKDVVDSVGDKRVVYVRNTNRMGAASNIDQCFSPTPRYGGSFGCLLEDDNFWLPDFLALVVKNANANGHNLMLANQRICEQGVGLRDVQETTRGGWFREGEVSPLDLRAVMLLDQGVSNGGLIWRLNRDVDLRVGPHVQQAGLQEICRSLLVKAPFLFIEQAEAVWTSMPKANTARVGERNRSFSRGMQSVRDFILRDCGRSVVDAARSLAQKRGTEHVLDEVLAYAGRSPLRALKAKPTCRALLKGVAIRAIEKDPCEEFIQSLQRETYRP